MGKYTNKYIIDKIIELLDPEIKSSLSDFSNDQTFWDKLVKIGSGHLILPAIYGSVKRKKLEIYLPKDLSSYLKKIYHYNSVRNQNILKQINFISKQFNKSNIDYVFLKGAAMLLFKPYKTANERMIGDIDILIAKKDLYIAQKILKERGYNELNSEVEFSKGLDTSEKRHLKRIIHPEHIAAVELHWDLLETEFYKNLNSSIVLRDKIKSSFGILIPSKNHLWLHSILNWQFNDYGKKLNLLGLRSVVDVLNLEPERINSSLLGYDSVIKHFYSLLSLHINKYPNFFILNRFFYKLQLKYWIISKLNLLIFKIFDLIFLIFSRLFLIFNSKIYRNRFLANKNLILKKISNFWNLR